MRLGIFAKEKSRKTDYLDMALIKLSCIAFGILLVILIPALNNVNAWWPLLATIVLAIRPTYKGIKRMNKKTVIIILLLGIIFNFLAFLSPLVLKVGGEFNSATGNYDIPVGFPLRFMKPDLLTDYLDQTEIYHKEGWRPSDKFHFFPFLINFVLWIFVSIIIIFSIKRQKGTHHF